MLNPAKIRSTNYFSVTLPLLLASITCSLLAVWSAKVWQRSDDVEIAKWITSFLWRWEVRWFYRIADRITSHLIFNRPSLKVWFAHLSFHFHWKWFHFFFHLNIFQNIFLNSLLSLWPPMSELTYERVCVGSLHCTQGKLGGRDQHWVEAQFGQFWST